VNAVAAKQLARGGDDTFTCRIFKQFVHASFLNDQKSGSSARKPGNPIKRRAG